MIRRANSMTLDPWLIGVAAGAVLILSFMAWLSALETAVLNTRRSRLAQQVGENVPRAVELILEAPEHFQTSAHLAKSLGESLLYPLAALGGIHLMLLSGVEWPARPGELVVRVWPAVLAAAVIAYLAVTLAAEAVPKSLAAARPEAILVRWAGFIAGFTIAFAPIRWLTSRLGLMLARSTGADPLLTARAAHSEEEIKLLVEGSAEEGVLEEEEKELIHSIFDFTETVARQVMVPRIDIISVSVQASASEVVRQALESGHSRLPVFEETLDSIVGVIHVKDLLPILIEGRLEAPIRDLSRDVYFVPEGKKIDELLHEFRRHKSQLAIVVDEFGGTSGLVTVEDVLEEIVGEIEDEYDTEEPPGAEVAVTGEGTLVDGRMTIDDVNEQLKLELATEDYETIGGFVVSLFGHPPEAGERVDHFGLEFVAETVDGLRLTRVRIIQREPERVGA